MHFVRRSGGAWRCQLCAPEARGRGRRGFWRYETMRRHFLDNHKDEAAELDAPRSFRVAPGGQDAVMAVRAASPAVAAARA